MRTLTDTAVKLNSVAPIFLVGDVAKTMAWYVDHLGFTAHPFPRNSPPPYVFCILVRDNVEIMLQALEGYEKPALPGKEPGGVWNAYLRVSGIRELYDRLRSIPAVELTEELRKTPHGDSEFAVIDPNGYVLIFSELI